MPRPAKADEDKRKLIGTRFNPGPHRQIESMAAEEGVSPGVVVERLATMFLDCDAKTLSLLRDIADEISAIESYAVESREVAWHENAEMFAAVEEMLRHGPLQRRKTLGDDVSKHLRSELEAASEKQSLVARLADMGVTVKEARYSPPSRAGLFGAGVNSGGLLGKYLKPPAPFDHRITEKAAIAAIPDEAYRAAAMRLYDQLVELDSAEEDARRKYQEAYAPTLELHQDGRELYRSLRTSRASEAMRRGEPYSASDLL